MDPFTSDKTSTSSIISLINICSPQVLTTLQLLQKHAINYEQLAPLVQTIGDTAHLITTLEVVALDSSDIQFLDPFQLELESLITLTSEMKEIASELDYSESAAMHLATYAQIDSWKARSDDIFQRLDTKIKAAPPPRSLNEYSEIEKKVAALGISLARKEFVINSTWLERNEELRDLVQSGYSKPAFVRCRQEIDRLVTTLDEEVQQFKKYPEMAIYVVRRKLLDVYMQLKVDTVPRLNTHTPDRQRLITEDGGNRLFAHIDSTLSSIEKLTFRACVVGQMKAGKSTFINSLIGFDICPMNYQAETAIPVIIRHDMTYTEAVLTIPDPAPFNIAIAGLREKAFVLAQYQDPNTPSSDETIDFNTVLDRYIADLVNSNTVSVGDERDVATWAASEDMNVFRGLHEASRKFMKMLYDGHLPLFRQQYTGELECSHALYQLNTVTRLCAQFDIPSPIEELRSPDWPLVLVKFGCFAIPENEETSDGGGNGITSKAIAGTFELVDCPGPDEALDFGVTLQFEQVLRTSHAAFIVINSSMKESSANKDVVHAVFSSGISENDIYIIANKIDEVHSFKNFNEEAFCKDQAFQIYGDASKNNFIFPCSAKRARLAIKYQRLLTISGTRRPQIWFDDKTHWTYEWLEAVFGVVRHDGDYQKKSLKLITSKNTKLLNSSGVEKVTALVRHLAKICAKRILSSSIERTLKALRKPLFDIYTALAGLQDTIEKIETEIDRLEISATEIRHCITTWRSLRTGLNEQIGLILEIEFSQFKSQIILMIGELLNSAFVQGNTGVLIEVTKTNYREYGLLKEDKDQEGSFLRFSGREAALEFIEGLRRNMKDAFGKVFADFKKGAAKKVDNALANHESQLRNLMQRLPDNVFSKFVLESSVYDVTNFMRLDDNLVEVIRHPAVRKRVWWTAFLQSRLYEDRSKTLIGKESLRKKLFGSYIEDTVVGQQEATRVAVIDNVEVQQDTFSERVLKEQTATLDLLRDVKSFKQTAAPSEFLLYVLCVDLELEGIIQLLEVMRRLIEDI